MNLDDLAKLRTRARLQLRVALGGHKALMHVQAAERDAPSRDHEAGCYRALAAAAVWIQANWPDEGNEWSVQLTSYALGLVQLNVQRWTWKPGSSRAGSERLVHTHQRLCWVAGAAAATMLDTLADPEGMVVHHVHDDGLVEDVTERWAA